MDSDFPLPIDVTMNTPLRLNVAAEIAFPDASMTGSGLANEHRRGRLEIERIDGKLYTTLGEIEKMRERCRVKAKGHVQTRDEPAPLANENGKIVSNAA